MEFRRIRDLREDHDLTQKQVAEMVGLNREVYRRYEEGIREMPARYIVQLAEYYDVSVDYIVGLTDMKKWEK